MSELRYLSPALDAISFADDEWVSRTGKIFAVGRYDHPQPEQRFEFTAEDAERVERGFQPVFAETEHFQTDGQPSIWDGKIGRLERIWRHGPELFGEMRVPRFVDRVWGEAGRKVSLVFDPETKQILRCGLVLKPRVPDAVMMSASDLEDHGRGEVALARSYTEFAERRLSGANADNRTKEQSMDKNQDQKGGGGAESAQVPVEFAQQLEAMRAENERLRKEQEQSSIRMAQIERERLTERARAYVSNLVNNKHTVPPALFNSAVAAVAMADEVSNSNPVKFAATTGDPERTLADHIRFVLENLPSSHMMQERVPAHLLRFSEDQTPEERARDPFSPEGSAAGARQWAEARNGRKG